MLDRLATEGRSRNNFDLLRLIAALLVLFAHSFNLLNVPEPLGDNVGWGTAGVMIFFSISGFLVARSWDLNPRLGSFAAKRALRLMPGLIVALLLTAFVLGPLVTSAPVAAYLRDPATKAYVLNNATLQSNWLLPGVFAHNVSGSAVNGSLWTLPLEAKAYLIIAIAGLAALALRWRGVMIVVAAYAVLATIQSVRLGLPGGRHYAAFLADIQMPTAIVDSTNNGILEIYTQLTGAFAIGAALYVLRRWIPLLWSIAGALFLGLIAVVLFSDANGPEALMVVTPYIVLCVAYRTSRMVHLPRRWGDYSYGIYVYAFPIQQTVIALLQPLSAWVLFFIATPPTVAAAALSWHFVERPALGLKRAFGGSTAETAPAESHLAPVASAVDGQLTLGADVGRDA
jgi:peptidoglycan/LPS O-acetylase OafA/YrhL